MNNCRDCRYWGASFLAHLRPGHVDELDGRRACGLTETGYRLDSIPIPTPEHALAEGTEGEGILYAPPSFGCVLWEAK